MKEKGINQKQLCKKLGFSEKHFSRQLNKDKGSGIGEMNRAWLVSIAQYFDCSPEWLSDINSGDEDVNQHGYNRKVAIENKNDILQNLFVLLGFSKNDYSEMTDNEINNMMNDLSSVVAYHHLNSRNHLMRQSVFDPDDPWGENKKG